MCTVHTSVLCFNRCLFLSTKKSTPVAQLTCLAFSKYIFYTYSQLVNTWETCKLVVNICSIYKVHCSYPSTKRFGKQTETHVEMLVRICVTGMICLSLSSLFVYINMCFRYRTAVFNKCVVCLCVFIWWFQSISHQKEGCWSQQDSCFLFVQQTCTCSLTESVLFHFN